jgi:glyoxylase-like metal-dependent hydrolase (beta-lactamase superfamily II)
MSASRFPAVITAAIVFAVVLCPPAPAQEFDQVEIKTIPVAESVFMLEGAGGNIGVSAGEDGVFLIDSQYGRLTGKIEAAVGALGDGPIRFVLNTHWHRDHTDGNENLCRAGALIVAHENVRSRMSTEQILRPFGNRVQPSPEAALPAITFSDSVTFHLNGDEIRVIHLEPAHTDGDSIVRFLKADVVHMGDIYFNGLYPFIDVSAGGSIDGMLAAVNRVLKMIGAETRIIPGHGPLSNREELVAYREMLQGVRDQIAPMVAAGRTRQEVIDSKPTAEFDANWARGFLTPEQFAGIVYDGMKER